MLGRAQSQQSQHSGPCSNKHREGSGSCPRSLKMQPSSEQWASLPVLSHLFLTKPHFAVSWLQALSASRVPTKRHKGWAEQRMSSVHLASTGHCVQVKLLWCLEYGGQTCTKCSECAVHPMGAFIGASTLPVPVQGAAPALRIGPQFSRCWQASPCCFNTCQMSCLQGLQPGSPSSSSLVSWLQRHCRAGRTHLSVDPPVGVLAGPREKPVRSTSNSWCSYRPEA